MMKYYLQRPDGSISDFAEYASTPTVRSEGIWVQGTPSQEAVVFKGQPFLKTLGDQFGQLLAGAAPILTTAHKAKIAELYSTINYNCRQIEDGNMNAQLGVALVLAAIDNAALPAGLDDAKNIIKTAIQQKYLG